MYGSDILSRKGLVRQFQRLSETQVIPPQDSPENGWSVDLCVLLFSGSLLEQGFCSGRYQETKL